MKAIAVIPARLASTRLPRKMLREIDGVPLVGHVYEAVRSSPLLEDVIVATDADEILQVCRKNGWNARMTSPAHRSGTERVHEISESVKADVYVNVQGDEPMIRLEHITALLGLMENPAIQVGTLATHASPTDVTSLHANKVVIDLAGRALYFSHATIPFDRDGAKPQYLKHLGIYAYRKPALDRFVALHESSLERIERLEQLRFLENGIDIHVAVTPYDSIGVDTEDDLQRFGEILQRSVPNTAVDSLTMLLSTDWFAGLWAVVGLKMEPEKEACLRKGCREIVREMISGTEEYWHIDFSDDRLAKTHALLDSLMKKCGLDKHLVERIDWLIEEGQQWKLDENTRSLLVHITDSLALNHLGFMLESITARGLGEFKPALDPTVEQALLRAWASYTTVEKMNFNDLCLKSQSEWDRYTRSLKPDLPESLSTSLTQELLIKIKFDLLSGIVERELTPGQKQGLLSWYAAVGEVLTGAPIAVPDL